MHCTHNSSIKVTQFLLSHLQKEFSMLREILVKPIFVYTRRYLDVESTVFEYYGRHMDVKTTLYAYWKA